MDPDLAAGIAELLARMDQMGRSGKYVVLTIDPQGMPGVASYGPFPGPEATAIAEQLRENYATTKGMHPDDDLTNVKVLLVPWEAWI